MQRLGLEQQHRPLASRRPGVLHNREAGASAPDDGWNGPQAGSGGPTADAIASESGRTGRRDARTPGRGRGAPRIPYHKKRIPPDLHPGAWW